MEQKSLGVIGGMGPKATSVFFEKVINNTDANSDQEHINMVILNHATMPDRTKAILTNNHEEFLQVIEKDIRLLEVAGVANIAIPCNTSHYFFDKMQEMTNIPIINMVEETAKQIRSSFGEGSKVGILATTGTIETGLYHKACEKYGLVPFSPGVEMQQKVMEIIYEDVKGQNNLDPTKLEGLIQRLLLEEGCQAIILACTELSCITINQDLAKSCVDALDVLVEKSIERSGKRLKREKTLLSSFK